MYKNKLIGALFYYLSSLSAHAGGFEGINVLIATEAEKETIRTKIYAISRIQANQDNIVKPSDTWEAFKIKAEQGDTEAQFKLGSMYRFATGGIVQKDITQALFWYKKAAAQGHINAFHCLGFMYKYGYEVGIIDYSLAANFLIQAANEGHVVSMSLLSHMYCQGLGVSQNRDLGKFWFDEWHIAAERIGQAVDVGLINL